MQPELARQAANAKEVRARLLNPPIKLKREHFEQTRDAIAELRAKVAELASELAARNKRIWKLELDVADREARIMGQAERIAMLDNAGIFVRPGHKPIAEIVAQVLQDFPGITWADIIGVRRTRALVKPRHLCMIAVYEQREDLSLPAIGRVFKRDHTSILAAVNKFGARRKAA